MTENLIPMSTWTPKDGQTYEIVDAEARERITAIEQGGGGGGGSGSGTVKSVNNVEPDASGNVTLSIPDAVTEQTISGWGFTKNTGTYSKPSGGIPDSDIASAATWNAKGTYSKPSGGIPASDMASAVQTSLGKADSALQQHQSLSGYATEAWVGQQGYGTYSKPTGGIPASDMASAVQTSLGKADTALQSHQSLSGYATEQWVEGKGYLTQHQSLANYQTKAITDTGGYFTTDTVEGALQEIGAELAGINTLIGSGVIT